MFFTDIIPVDFLNEYYEAFFWMRKWTFRDVQVSSASGVLVFGPDLQLPSTCHTTLIYKMKPTLIYKTPKWALEVDFRELNVKQ